MTIRTKKIALALASTAVVLSACGGTVALGRAQPQLSGTSVTGPTVPDNGAPKVEHPLDVRAFLLAPCSTLTTTQLSALNLHAKGIPAVNGPLGPECSWKDSDGTTKGTYLAVFVKGGQGLTGAYSNRNTGFFEEISPIAGYPAVISMAGDGRAQGDCNLAIGLNDHLSIGVGAGMSKGAPNYKNPCGVAAKIAEKMVETMKGAK